MLSLKKLLYKILSVLHTPLTIGTTLIPSQRYAGGGSLYGSLAVTQISGYSPLCVVGWDAYSANVSMSRLRKSGDTLLWTARNNSSSVVDSSITVYILYIRSDLA